MPQSFKINECSIVQCAVHAPNKGQSLGQRDYNKLTKQDTKKGV